MVKITILLLAGKEYGPKLGKIGGWSGKAVYSPLTNLSETLKREEFDYAGIYFLKSFSETEIYDEKIYVGETENLRRRLKQHIADDNKEFEECVVFVSPGLLTKAHIKFLESQLVEEAKQAKRAEIVNANEPTKSYLPEEEIYVMDEFYYKMKLVLPLLGFIFLKPTASSQRKVDKPADMVDKITFELSSSGITAFMQKTDDGFIVLAGSQARKDLVAKISPGWGKRRNRLIEEGIWDDKGNHYEFKEDVIFNSPSAASSTIVGRPSAGPNMWKDNNKKTYKDYENMELDSI